MKIIYKDANTLKVKQVKFGDPLRGLRLADFELTKDDISHILSLSQEDIIKELINLKSLINNNKSFI